MRSANFTQGSGSDAMAGLLYHTLKVFYEIQAPANENRSSEQMLGGAVLCFTLIFRLVLHCGVCFFI